MNININNIDNIINEIFEITKIQIERLTIEKIIDISNNALKEVKSRTKKFPNSGVFYNSDILDFKPDTCFDLWHDRAVLHFFTEQQQQEAYFKLLKTILKPNGYVILAEFNLEGAKKCCGLNVINYNEIMLQERLGVDFKLLKTFNYTYTQPSGNTREYIYTLFQRIE